MDNTDNILIKIVRGNEEHLFNTREHEYRSLMALIRDRICPDEFGECGGMGRCATCQVRLEGTQAPTAMHRNEQSTLNKSGVSDPSIRLSCQLQIDAALNNGTVFVLEQ